MGRGDCGVSPSSASEPESCQCPLCLGDALAGKGDVDGAIAEFREVVRLDPKDEFTHVNLGDALASKGDVDGAITEYREALRLDPKDEVTHVNLGDALASKGDCGRGDRRIP